MKHLAFITAAALLSASTPAFAEAIPPKARKLAEHGREMHKRGEYDRAITAFKEAYVIAPSAGLLFNIAQAYRLQGNCDDASLMYKRFLSTNPDPAARSVAETHLATVERCLQKRSLNIPIDESLAYLNVPPPPGPEKVIDKDRHDIERPSHIKKDIGMGLTVAGGVALLTAGYFGYRAYEASREVEAAYARGEKWPQVKEIDARGKTAERSAKLFGIGGGLAVAGGVALWVIGRREERANQLAVTPASKGTGAQVSYSWSF